MPHVLFFGGTVTYGKFVPRPYPAMIESQTPLAAVNLGAVNAGPDLYVNDSDLLAMTGRAAATVVQIPGVPNMTNRYYSVHPRRNDRFLKASALLRTVYRDVDFSTFHFTRHMLQTLQELSLDRFAILLTELREAWIARMSRLIQEIESPVVLLWFANRPAATEFDPTVPIAGNGDPLFVDAGMIDRIAPGAAAVVHAVASPEAQAQASEGMVFSQMEAAAAHCQLGVQAHAEAAQALAPVLRDLLPNDVSARLN
jgi:hypothetical protein